MKNPRSVIDADIVQISSRYAELKKISTNKALEIFFGSKTYKTLINIETGLCYEMTDYIYEIFLEEMRE